MLFAALILFIVVPIAELYVIIQVGGEIGVPATIALLILDSLLGAALLRSQSRAAWARFNNALEESRIPAREVFDGAAIILGGALLLTPGFITDIFGLLLLIPPTRDLVRRAAMALGLRRVPFGRAAAGAAGAASRRRSGPVPGPGAAPPPHPSRSYDVEGTATEIGESGELGKGSETRG